MKKCEKCGVPQKDSNFRCVECGAILGKPLSDEEKELMEEQISDYIEDRAERTETFYITRLDKTMIALDILGVIASVLVMIFAVGTADAYGVCIITMFAFILAGVDTAFPRIGWSLEKLRVTMRYHVEHLEPSEWYLLVRRVGNVAIPTLAYMALIFVLLHS